MKKPILVGTDGKAVSSMSPAQLECIQKLEEVLESARKGEVLSCAIIATGPFDFGLVIAGADAPRLNLGLDAAKAEILKRVVGGGRDSVLRR